MTEGVVLEIGQNALLTVVMVTGPMLGLGMAAGLIVSIFQATTQVQEQTLSFIPKILAVIFALMVFGPWMLGVMLEFTYELFTNIPQNIGI